MGDDLTEEELRAALNLKLMSDEETEDESAGVNKVLLVHRPVYRSEMVRNKI